MLAARSLPKAKPVSSRGVLRRCHPVSHGKTTNRMPFLRPANSHVANLPSGPVASQPAGKSNRICTYINRAPNLRRISTCEFFELKTLQNQHLQKNFEGGGDLRSYVRPAAPMACRRRNADEKLPSPDEDRRR